MDRTTFVIRKNGTKQKAHVWTGEDTACRMWSTGGLKHSRYDFRDSPCGRKICWMCAHITGLREDKNDRQKG